MNEDGDTAETAHATVLDAFKDARAVVRLFQCPQCSLPFRSPITLPCGNSLCRQCLPPAHLREGVSYPGTESRRGAYACPFPSCGQAHSLGDCNSSVCLQKIMDTVNDEIEKSRNLASGLQTSMEELIQWKDDEGDDAESASQEKGHSRMIPGGRLVATYTFAEMGELLRTSDVQYDETDASNMQDADQETLIFERLKSSCHKELECHVCYGLMLDPLTTPCGHTFCRKCLARVLDYAGYCPVCRRELSVRLSWSDQSSCQALATLLQNFYADELDSRAETVGNEERTAPGGLNTPLFVCTPAFPTMPMLLHIFEPRYRLMIRRAMESNRQFGMLVYNHRREPQGDLGRVDFHEIGVMLHIEQHYMYPDGRSMLLCRGLYRFKVLSHGVLDGYTIGRVEKLEDIPLAEEERIEAEETSQPQPSEGDASGLLNRMSTRQLLDIGLTFAQRASQQSFSWMHTNILEVYGPPPDDAATFPYWFASVCPLREEEKYRLLPANSVRERLKIIARWVHYLEAQRW